ncbi:hypothetical protein BegalDRAFT_3414 [Beggiatoa alba B18LD]|uniref:Uncharacterized protein n=1 Tax=Beggiatoa alba B18LD TaxID=395493 RepID=I3CKT8_9GAMM|nr:hypothetical protein [Beggiatoa alba]EIJ44231.1 hypothetical protein BegalDRAFT_3414 [Beggiatoa alba B18LD]
MKSILKLHRKKFLKLLCLLLFFTLPLFITSLIWLTSSIHALLHTQTDALTFATNLINSVLLICIAMLGLFPLSDFKTWVWEQETLTVYHFYVWKQTYLLSNLTAFYVMSVTGMRQYQTKPYQILILSFKNPRTQKTSTLSFSSQYFKNFALLVAQVKQRNISENKELIETKTLIFWSLLAYIVFLILLAAILTKIT